MSEAAEQLEAMAAEAKADMADAAELVKKIKARSGYEVGVREGTELSLYMQKERCANQPHCGNLLPLHSTSIKQESGYISEP